MNGKMFFILLLFLTITSGLTQQQNQRTTELSEDTNEPIVKEVKINNGLTEDREQIDSPVAHKNTRIPQIDYTVCDNKLCLGLGSVDGSDCISKKSCDMLLSGGFVDKIEGQTEWEINAILTNMYAKKYWSMAFSSDDKMGDDLVTDCLRTSDGKVKIQTSHNIGKTNELTDEYRDSLQTFVTNTIDGIVNCKWRSHRKRTVGGQEWDLLSNKYHILLAFGNLTSDFGSKLYHTKRMATPEPIGLESTGAISASDPIYLVRIHGTFMVIAWVGTVSLGILFARYFKNTWVESTVCGVKIWFAFHRGLMVTSVVLMLIAQTCIFYYLKEYRIGWHQIFGSIAFTIALLNPLGALLRPHPNAPDRWIFNWGHWALGNTGHITAIVAIFLSTTLPLADLPKQFLWTVVSFVLFYVVIHLLLQFHTFCIQTRKTHDIALQDMDRHPDADQMGTDAPGSGFRRFILGIYCVVILGFVIALVSLICLPKSTLDLMAIT